MKNRKSNAKGETIGENDDKKRNSCMTELIIYIFVAGPLGAVFLSPEGER